MGVHTNTYSFVREPNIPYYNYIPYEANKQKTKTYKQKPKFIFVLFKCI